MLKSIKITICLSIVLICNSQVTYSQNNIDKILKRKIENNIKGFNGDVGVFVQNLKNGKVVEINADSLFPTASMVKVPIMVGIFDMIEKGELKYNQEVIFRDSLKYDDGIIGSLKDSSKVLLSELIFLMESVSENNASLWLQKMVTGTRINKLLESYGFQSLRVNSRTAGREHMRSKYGWGVCTPKEMTQLMIMINNRKIISESASDRMIRTLGYQFWDAEGLSQLPSNVKFASKTGAVDKSRSEVAIIFGPSLDYAYCIVTKNQKDTSYERNNEGFELIRSVSSIIFNHYNPKSKYTPTTGYEKYSN